MRNLSFPSTWNLVLILQGLQTPPHLGWLLTPQCYQVLHTVTWSSRDSSVPELMANVKSDKAHTSRLAGLIEGANGCIGFISDGPVSDKYDCLVPLLLVNLLQNNTQETIRVM